MRFRLQLASLQHRACERHIYLPLFMCRRHSSHHSKLDPSQLTSLRRAIANNDIDKTQQQLQDIIASGIPNLLSAHDLRDVSRLLQNNRPPSSSSLRPGINEVALFLATKGHTEALESCMNYYLTSDTPELAGLLWKRLQHTLTAAKVSMTGIGRKTPSPPHISMTYLKALERCLALGIVSFATRGERESALQAGLGVFANIPIHTGRIERIASSLVQDHVFPVVHQYCEEIRVARLLERPRGASIFVDAVCETGDVRALLQLFRAIVNGIEAGWIAPNEPLDSLDRSSAIVMMTELVWSTFISGFMKLNRLDAAQAVWERMTSFQVAKTTTSWNAFLAGLIRCRRFDQLMQTWSKMDRSNVSKDLVSYTTTISALFQAKRSEDALRLWNEAQVKIARGELPRLVNTPERGVPSNDAQSGGTKSLVILYNCVLHGLLISAKPDEAFSLLKQMRCNGPQPDVTTLNTFIRYYSRKGNMSAAASFLRLFEELCIRPDVFTFTSVLHACLQSGVPTPDAVLRVQVAMEVAGVTPNVVMYSAIIDQTVRHGGRDNIDTGFEWLRAMEAQGLKANEVTYTALLTALQKDRGLSGEYVRQKMDEIIQRMGENGSPRNRVTFNVLIKASLLNSGDPGLKNAVEHYRQMVARGIKANNDTWYILLHGALLRRSFGVGRRLLAEMLESGFVPRGALEGIVKKIRAGETSGTT